jgi:putative tryptophan/tyrosine transport system substrate-binding protein
VTIRRSLGLLLLLVLFAVPLAAGAQQTGTVPRVSCLVSGADSAQAQTRVEAFRQGLRELGYVEGQNIVIAVQPLGEKIERFPDIAAEVVRRKPDVIVAASNAAVAALKQATHTIPIVAAIFGDPVGSGLIVSLARPGGNITGLSNASEEISTKWLELLKETVPNLARVGVLWVPTNPAHRRTRQIIESAGQKLGIAAQFEEIGARDDVTRAFVALTGAHAGALIALADAVTNARRRQIMELTVKHRLPAMYALSEYVEEGGLMAYAPNTADMFRRAAYFVDKILRGTKPGDLPVEQPTKFELVINLKTAKALSLTIPRTVLQRADQVIE